MRSLMLLILGIILIGLLSYICFMNKGEIIGDDLISKTKNAHKINNLKEVDVNLEGKDLLLTRIVVLSGSVTNIEDKKKAEVIANDIDGVMKVKNNIVVKTPVLKIIPKIVLPKKISCQEKFRNLLSTQKINFKLNLADIKPISYDLLDKLVLIAKGCPDDKIIIKGYTDSDGSDEYNKNLSAKRANTVKDYLVKKDILASRLEAVGYGEIDPIADNNTTEGRQKNRRIEFDIKGEN